MHRLRSPLVTGAAALLALVALGGIVLADGGGAMNRMMGATAYQAMVARMQAALGPDRAAQMIAGCESMLGHMGDMSDMGGNH